MSEAWKDGSDSRWRRFRLTILDRDRWECTIQGQGCTGRAEHVDHIQPLAKGGDKYDPSNCRAACAVCNLGRSTKDPIAQPEPRPTSSW